MLNWLELFLSETETGDFVPPYTDFYTDFIFSTKLCFKIYSIKH